jgi:hypothetical protein
VKVDLEQPQVDILDKIQVVELDILDKMQVVEVDILDKMQVVMDHRRAKVLTRESSSKVKNCRDFRRA